MILPKFTAKVGNIYQEERVSDCDSPEINKRLKVLFIFYLVWLSSSNLFLTVFLSCICLLALMLHAVVSVGVIRIKNIAHCGSFALWWLIKTFESIQSKR